MILKPYRWYPDADNTGIYYDLNTDYLATIFPDNTSLFAQAGTNIREIGRTDRPPARANKELRSKTLTLKMLPKATAWHSKVDEIHTYFQPKSKTIGRLVCQDLENSNKEWYVDADVEDEPRAEPGKDGVQFRLRVYEPDWKTVALSTATWLIAGDTSTKDLTTLGNSPAYPVFDIQVTSPKTTGSQRKIYRAWRNPNSIGAAGEPLDIVNNAWDTASLINDTTVSNQVNHVGGYTSAALSIALDTAVGGGLNTNGGMAYCARTGEQIKYSSITAGNMIVPSDGRGWGGSTAAALLDNDVFTFSHMAKDGRDIRVRDNGSLISRWLDGMNTATTNIFVVPDFAPALEFSLRTAINGVDDITVINIKLDQLVLFTKLAAQEVRILGMGTGPNMEIFSYEAVDLQNMRVTGVKRAIIGSSKATHAIGDTIYYIPHIYEVDYCNSTMTAPTQDESRKPLLDMANSTNLQWKCNEFFDSTGLRAAQWLVGKKNGYTSHIYSKTQDDYADPAEEIGFAAIQLDQGGGLKPDTYEMSMMLYSMSGFSNVLASGKRKRTSTDFGTAVEMRNSQDGITWFRVFAITSPSSPNSWDAWTQASLAIATPRRYFDLHIRGSIKAVSGNAHYLELGTITLDRPSATIPQLAYSSTEQINAYEIDAVFTNSDSALDFSINTVIDYNETLRIDTENHQITYLRDGVPMNDAIKYDARGEILPIDPGLVTDKTNTYAFSDTGTTGLSIAISWHDRMAG